MASNTDKRLQDLTNAIERLVSREVAPIAPVAPVLPVLPIAPQNHQDHDLLTKLDTKVDQIQNDVTALKNRDTIYVTKVEHIEVVRIQADHETRTRILETATTRIMTWGTMAIIFLGIAEFLVQKYL